LLLLEKRAVKMGEGFGRQPSRAAAAKHGVKSFSGCEGGGGGGGGGGEAAKDLKKVEKRVKKKTLPQFKIQNSRQPKRLEMRISNSLGALGIPFRR